MSMVFEMALVGEPDTVRDVITFADGRVSYSTGEAQSLVEARMQQLASKVDAMDALADWSNGYVSIRAARSGLVTNRITATPVSVILAEPTNPTPAHQ